MGPIYAHVAKIELGADRDNKGKFFTEYLCNLGFKILDLKFDNYREDEIWITAEKS